jgi:amino-acid N-acetyltransferase
LRAKTSSSSNNPFTIEEAKTEDMGHIHRLLTDLNLPLDGLNNTQIWIAKGRDREVLGSAGLETWATQGLVRSVAVKKEFQGSGVGGKLVRHVISEAGKR